MATKKKEMETEGVLNQKDLQQENYEQKFQEMQKYIPFLEMMIQRLERSSDKSREAQLLKMKSLRCILSNTKKKLNIATLKRCEDVLQKLHEKVEKGTSAQAKHATVKPAEEKRTTGNAQESANPGSSVDGNDQQVVTSSTDGSSVTDIMKTLKMAAARTSGKSVSSATSCPDSNSGPDDIEDAHTTAGSCVPNMPSSEKKNKALDDLEQSRERLKKLMEQQTSLSTESAKKPDGRLGSPSMEWQYQTDPPWEKQDYEKGTPKPAYPHSRVMSDPDESNSRRAKPVKDISASEEPQFGDELWGYGSSSRSELDGSRTGWRDYKPPVRSLWPSDVEQHGSTVPNKPSLNQTCLSRVPTSLPSPSGSLSQQAFATNGGMQSCSSPNKKSLPKVPTLYNVLKHPPAAGSKPLSDADIEELLEDTNRSESEPGKKEESPHMSLRAKLEQEIQQVHRVGVSKGGALRSLVQKDDKLKSPVRNILDMMKPNSELKKEKSVINRLQASGKSDSVMGSALKASDEKASDISQNKCNTGSHVAEKGDNRTDFGIFKDALTKSIKDRRPTDPRRRASFSPRGEESQNSPWEDVHPPAGDKNDPRVKLSTDVESNYGNLGYINRDLPLNDKLEGPTKKEGTGILSSLSKEELQKIVEDNLRNLPSPPPNTKEILETVHMNSPTAMKPVWQQPADFLSPMSSPKECNQSGFMSPIHSSHYGSQVESHIGIGRNSTSYSSFGIPRPEDRRPLLPTPNVPHDPRVLPRNVSHDPRYSRDNQVPLSNIHDPRVNVSSYSHHDNYRSGILPHPPHDQYMRPVSSAYHQNPHTKFHSNQTPHLQTATRWVGTSYGALSHNSPRITDESFMRPGDSYPQHGANSSRFHCSPHSSQNEFSQFPGQINPMHDHFSGNRQQHPSWQSPSSSQGCFRSGSSANYPSSARSVGQAAQHHGNISHGVNKIPVGDPRLSNPQFSGHCSPVSPQGTSVASVRSSGVSGTVCRAQSMDGRSGNTLSERDPRRKSIEETEKGDCNSRSNRESRKISSSSGSSNYGSILEQRTDKGGSNERRRDSDARKFEPNSFNRRRSSPEPNKPKETELVSPLNSLYDIAAVPKTGKGYGFQKFRIPKIKRPPSPPKTKSPSPQKAKSPPPTLESSSIIGDTKEKAEVTNSTDKMPVTRTETLQSSLRNDSSDDVPSTDAVGDDKGNDKCIVSMNHENAPAEKSCDMEAEKTNSESRSKEEVTQEWIEALIRKSFECGEGKKFIEQARLLEKLGESLKGKKLRKIKRILESDSDSGSDENDFESSKKNEKNVNLDKEDQKTGEEGGVVKKVEMSMERNKKPKYRRLILSDDDQSTDSETLASKLKTGAVEVDKPLSVRKSKGEVEEEEEDDSSKIEDGKSREKKQSTSSDEVKPTRRYSKRRSALELLQEDIREMFICEGVVTATGHRMCRLLKESPPGMTVDEISKSTVKITEDEIYTTAEESDGSSVICKRRSKKVAREEEFDRKGREQKVDKKQKGKVKMKDEEREYGVGTGCSDASNELDESRTNSRAKNKDGSLIDDTGDRSRSPVTKPCKRYEKSRWKGYVIEESEDSAEEVTVSIADKKKESLAEKEDVDSYDKPRKQCYSHRGRPRSKLYPTDESNSERGRRARLPRVILEKADISKLNLTSSKPRTRYFEDSSSDESLVEDITTTPVNNVKSKFKAARKSRTKVRHAYQRRGRGGASKRGRKKQTKVDRNDEFSTDVESIVSDHSSIASSVSHQTNLENTSSPIGFTFRRKCNKKISKFLGKKIDDIIKRLTKDDGFKREDVTVNSTNSEEKLSESGRGETSMEEIVAEAVNVEVKEKENVIKIDDASISKAATNKFGVSVAKSDVETESTRAPNVGKKRNSRIMLNLVRTFGIQKRVKKKKTKWQLGIINCSKKKSGIKLKSEVEARDVTAGVACEKEVNTLNKAVKCTELTDESSSTDKVGSDVSINEGREEEDKVVSSKQIVTASNDKLDQNIELKQINETEDNRMLQMNDSLEMSNIRAGKSDETLACLESENDLDSKDKSPTVLDQSYVLDGSAKYACKLCLVQCKNIVPHYKNYHPESEVLISRLPVEEASRAISEALESNYKEDVGSTECGKKKKKQAGKFICRICDHTAAFALNFYEHLSSHTGEYRFRCGKCSYEASTRHSVKGHFYYHHPELKGVESVQATVLTPGPPNEAKFVFGYLCSSCNFVQLLKQNTEKHISLRHPSESNAKSICINMSKITRNDTVEGESKNVCTDEGAKESSDNDPDNMSLDAESRNGEEVCNVVSPVINEMTPEEDLLGSTVTGINVTDKKPGANSDMTSKPCEAVYGVSMEKEEKSEIEPSEAVCETPAENPVNDPCMLSSGKPEVTAVYEEPHISQELSAVDSDMDAGDDDAQLSVEAVEDMQLKQKTDETRKNDIGNSATTISETEEAAKEVDLKAFVCSDDLEEENSVIQKERLKKMQEIAQNLKDTHPEFLQSNRRSILDQLSDKLKTGLKSKTVDTTLGERNETVDSLINSKESESKEGKSQAEKLTDVSTLIDEKRAIEAAQAVQNLLRAEKETTDDKQSTGIGHKMIESPNESRSGRHNKPCTGDTIARRITRSFSKNEDDVDIETVDESSSDISFVFEGEDNDDIVESETQSPDTLLNETLSVLKDASPRKSASRMFDIIERLASKVVPKTEPSDTGDRMIEMDIPEASSSTIAKELHVGHSSKDSEMETRETDGFETIANKKSSSVIGKPPPLISLRAKEKHVLRVASAVGDEGSFSSIRVGPLEARRFSDRLLYSCCIRGCIFASTDRMSFASHIDNTHKVSRWDGSCQACNNHAKRDQHGKLSHALHHLIKFHLVASPHDLSTPGAMNSNEQDISELSSEETSFGEGEVSAEIISESDIEILTEQTSLEVGEVSPENTSVGVEGMPVENMSVEQEVSKKNTSLIGGDNSNSTEGGTEAPAPRKFIRLRRLSGDLLSIPKPMEDPVTTDVQEQAFHKDDMEINQLIREVPVEEVNDNEEDSGPFLKIESVVSLNPDAMGTEDVNEIFRAVEDPQNASKSSEKLDPGDDSDVTSSPANIYSIPSSSNAVSSTGAMSTTVIENSIPFMTTAPGPSTGALRTSSPDLQLLTSSSPLPISVLRGKAPGSHGTMHMFPLTPLSKSSTITILPSLQQLSPMKLNNVQLSPVKLASFKSPDIASKPSVATNIPHSLMGLAQITRPTNSKVTVAKEKLSGGMIGGGIWCNQVLPNILPKGTFVRLEIKDNQVTAKSPVVITSKSQAPVMVNMKTAPSLTMTTNTTSSVGKAPISSVSVNKRLEVKVTVPSIVQKGKSSPGLAPPPVPFTAASNTVLSTIVSKSKLPHKSAVAPSYAKASKVPSVYQEMIKPLKLRHLYKCMARLCSYTTDSVENYTKHYNEHENHLGQRSASEKKKGRPPAAKMSDWQQCAYCCAIQTSLAGVLEHMQTEHGHCLYQCAYCFYRAVTKSYIVLHQNTSHTSEHVAVLMCREIKDLPSPVNAVKPRSSVVVPYICEQGSCGAVFYIPESFLHHLEKEHSQLAIYTCHMCGSKSFKPDRLLAHYKLHSCCFYQCMYCLHGTDTKEEMHHHLCNFHSNQMAKVIIRASSTSELAALNGKQSEEDLLNVLDVLDLDEGLSDDGLLVLPPPEKEPAAEDPSLPASITCSELQESSYSNRSNGSLNINTGMNPEERALDAETTNAESVISSEPHSSSVKMLGTELKGKESKKQDHANIVEVSDYVAGSNNKSLNSNSSACGNDQNTDDEIVIIDDSDNCDISHTQPLPQQNSHIGSEVGCLKPNETHSSQQDSDVECLEESCNSQKEEQKLNETHDSDVIFLDNSVETVGQGTESMSKVLAKKVNTDLILQEPLVTVKHRDPRRSAAIAAAVDPLSIELPQDTGFPQNESEAQSVTSSQQSTSTISLPATSTGLDSETANCMINSTETSQNELSTAAVEDLDDTGLSGSMLYQCGYVTCTFSAEVSSLLKDHLLVCDLARASSSLTCVHCKKQFKYVNSLLEHLRTHGTSRFSCALCSFRAPVPQQVAKHLKQKHRIGSTRVIPLNPLRTDPETAMFVVFPKDKGKGGHGGKSSGKNTQDVRSKLVFLPEDVELLPLQAIYTRPVRCATCSYTTKVRSNMVRHLHLHLTSSIIPDVVPPENAPVNPVPCLEKKEMMFDKMTNLAASSHIPSSAKASDTPSGSLTLTEELEARLPKFVPEHQRYVCGAPGCSYLTCDETMLRYHLRALHFDETAYRCPHCPTSALQENVGQVVSIERMGAHLKMHDSRLYKCAHCMYHHFQRYVVERHLADKHPEKRPFVQVVREPDVESGNAKTEASASTSLEGAGNSSSAGALKNPWHCGLCKFQCSTRSEVLDHTSGVHGLKSQFKCGLCSYRSSSKASFDSHFASRHPAAENVELIHVYRKVDTSQTSQSGAKIGPPLEIGLFDTTPLWRRDMQRVRHIRGILLEEEGDVPKPDIIRRTSIDVGEMEEKEGKFGPYGKPIGNLYCCTLCSKYRTKFKADFRDHLYRELSYHKWVCTHCSQVSCNRSSLQKHSARMHEKDRKPEAIAPLTPNKDIEEWVEKVISVQLAFMKIEHQAPSEGTSSSNKILDASLANVAQPGPSGLSGSASIPGLKASSVEREDLIVTGSTSSDSDTGTSKRKVSVVRDVTDNMKVSSKNVSSAIPLEDSVYTKKASQDTMKLLRFPCKHCNMKFSLIRGLKVHIRHNHLKLSIWTCGHCGYVANSEESVLNHSKVDHPDLPPKCLPHTKGSCVKLDDEFWQREYGLGQGSEYKYLNTPVITPSSASSSPGTSPLKKRQRTSSSPAESEESLPIFPSLANQNLNKCLYCEYFCRSASDLKYHMMRHWVQKPYKCGYCDFEGVREYEIKKHSAKIHPLKKLRVIEKPMPSQPDIRPLQRNKRSKPDIFGPTSNTSVREIGHEKVMKSGDSEVVDTAPTEDKVEDEQQNTSAFPNIFCCFYCPQRGTSVVSIHQHWQEKHKRKLMSSNGVMRLGLPFKYKEVNMKQFLKGQNGSAGRRPAFQCPYCKFRSTLAGLEGHQKAEHPDKPFRVSQASFTSYECAECRFTAFTVNTLKKHFEIEHVGKELQYLVKPSKANFISDIKRKDSLVVSTHAASSGLPAAASVATAKYMCLWCEETCDSEDTIQVHHAMCHSHLQLKYSVEKSSTPTVTAANISKNYSCPSCKFVSDSSQSMSKHVQNHVKHYTPDHCPRTFEFPTKVSSNALLEHPEEECKMIHVRNAEQELEKLRSDMGIRIGGESGMQCDSEACVVPPPPKKLCVARKSTTLSPRIGKFHAVARKSTNPLLSQTAKKVILDSCYDTEQGEATTAPSSRSESPAVCPEFSYYGCRPASVDKNRITASVKLRNNLGVNMNMSLATMERFTNMYPVVKVKDLKYEKWALTH